MSVLFVYSLVTLVLLRACDGGKILLSPWVPFMNSRLNSMVRLGEMMAEDGHQVAVLLPTFLQQHVTVHNMEVITFEVEPPMFRVSEVDMAADPDSSDTGSQRGQRLIAGGVPPLELPLCEAFYRDTALQGRLKERRFDLLFADMFYVFTRVVIDFLDVPTLLYSPDGSMFDTDVFYPSVPSFVCGKFKSYCDGDRLPFSVRLWNFASDVSMQLFLLPHLSGLVDELRAKYNINASVPSRDAYRKHVVIANLDFLMEAPRPVMPHIIQIPCLFVEDASPVQDAELKELFDSAEDGAIVMSLGTVTSSLGADTDKAIADVFVQLSQKVAWKYEGPALQLGSNIVVRPWLPQADLLAHPNAALFITHGGSHSMYEAVHHAVPVICIPFYLDQFAQCRNLVNRLKMGVLLYPKDLTKETFTKAVHQVLGNPEYKANAVKAQSILRDQPVKPRDLFLYWVNYTIRHQGAKHLVATAPFELNIFQYLSLDVVAFLTLPPLLTFVVCLKCLCWLCCGKKATDGNSEKKTQ